MPIPAKEFHEKSPTGCRPSSYIGEWMIDSERLEQLKEFAFQHDFNKLAEQRQARMEAEEKEANGEKPIAKKPYRVDNGVAIFRVTGPTMKYGDSFDVGTSTVKLIRALDLAAADPEVTSGLMHLEDAPGGTVAGAYETRDAIERFAKVKPIEAYIQDLGTSAAYLFASACTKVTANKTAYVGSIGTLSQLRNSKKHFDKEGVEVIPLSTGIHKHTGMPGVDITPEQIAARKAHVDGLNEHFVESVSRHRKIPRETLIGMQAGIMLAPDAMKANLIDAIDSFENVLKRVQSENKMERPAENVLPYDPNRGFAMNLLERIQAILNDKSLTEVQAAERIQALVAANATATQTIANLNASLKSLTEDRDALKAVAGTVEPEAIVASRLTLLLRSADLEVKSANLPATAAAAIKQACGANDDAAKAKPAAFMLSPRTELGGKSIGEWAIGLFDGAPVVKDGAKANQATTRDVPGETAAIIETRRNAASKDDKEALESADKDVDRFFPHIRKDVATSAK